MRALTKKNLMILVSILLTFGIVQVLLTVGIINSFYEITIATICINIILAVSLNLVTGFTGQFSLGHAGFMSIGAYVCAIVNLQMNSTVGFLVGTFAGALVAAIVGILVGIPTLRLRGDYLAIATLGMAEIIRVVFLNMEITNGAAGLNGIPRYTNWLWLFVFTAGTIILINNFIKSSHGRACISIREDEIAAESMGINTTKYKVMAFAIGAFFAGVAGALYSSYFFFVKPDLFGFLKSIDILVIVVLGGMGSLTGSIIAAVVLAVISTFLQQFTAVRMIVYAALLVLIMIFRPQGIMGTREINDLLKFKPRKKDDRIE
jgi:branched-chain amino acid transport system permease protein